MRGVAVGKVHFLVAGTQKGGTSALHAHLCGHPQVCMASRKEVHFFDDDSRFRNGRKPDYAGYHRYFAPAAPDLLLGECTPIYMYWRDAPRRIRDYNPAMKLILTLRNPMDRAFSHWNMQRDRKRESLCFWDGIMMEPERCRDTSSRDYKLFSYLDRGFYTRQLANVWRSFPKHQTLVLRHDELRSRPGEVLDRLCDFLGVARFPALRNREVHSTPYTTRMTRFEWHYLKRLYEPEIRLLESVLNWDCGDWLVEPDLPATREQA